MDDDVSQKASQVRDRLREYASHLQRLADGIQNEPTGSSVALALLESAKSAKLWNVQVNIDLQKYHHIYFETPHGHDPNDGRWEECSCGHWRIKD